MGPWDAGAVDVDAEEPAAVSPLVVFQALGSRLAFPASALPAPAFPAPLEGSVARMASAAGSRSATQKIVRLLRISRSTTTTCGGKRGVEGSVYWIARK